VRIKINYEIFIDRGEGMGEKEDSRTTGENSQYKENTSKRVEQQN
jgi:hypothetical protein